MLYLKKKRILSSKLGFFKLKNSKLSKQMKGYFARKKPNLKVLKEFRVENNDQYKEGNELGLEIFKDKKFLDVRSKTIGKGFAGVMKRWNFGGLRNYMVFQFHIDLTVQQDNVKILVKYLKERKWLVTWR